MCISPVKVKNPYYSSDPFEYREGDILPLSRRFVSSKEFIEVPCGKCADCRDSYSYSI